MKPENQAVMDGIMSEAKSLTLTQRRVFLRAMKNPYFFPIAFEPAGADAHRSSIACRFIRSLMGGKENIT